MDPFNTFAAPAEIYRRFKVSVQIEDGIENENDLVQLDSVDPDDEDDEEQEDRSDETDDLTKPEAVEKNKRRLRLKRLKRKTKARAYEFSGAGSDVVGIVFLELSKITDLPPERNSRISLSPLIRHSS